ncbi:hypothetical protein [Gimesia aquarii]|uniref:Uncharacterized protein n=1 Tax=Gimesia aquarii TaxID=2527964 RepID=A0A517VYF7_9PLAN|nr:hypothetical protein [Gimesia aquarii]QDT98035.1 hypothetical protein V144x_35190 [Gimesia aquarii]
MKWKEWLDKWSMSSVKLSAGFAELEFSPKDPDRDAAWELYIELLTRVTTQHVLPEHNEEKTALTSIYKLFGLTRETLKNQGRQCNEFTKIAIPVLNQVVRPFTSKWYRKSLDGAFEDEVISQEFHVELADIQIQLRKYTKMLADMANVEDLTELDDTHNK